MNVFLAFDIANASFPVFLGSRIVDVLAFATYEPLVKRSVAQTPGPAASECLLRFDRERLVESSVAHWKDSEEVVRRHFLVSLLKSSICKSVSFL